MDRRRRCSRFLLAGLALLAAIPACRRGGHRAPVRVGVAGPMTGEAAKQGVDIRNGVQVAVDEWNAKGGVLGRPIELLAKDDTQDARQAANVAWELVEAGVAGVIGHYNTHCTIPASAIYAKKDVVMITPAATHPEVTDRGLRNVFRVCGRDDQQAEVAAQYVSQNLRDAQVAVLHDKTTYGQGLASAFRKSYETHAGKKVVFFGGVLSQDMDYTAVLTDLKSYSPSLVFFGGLYPQAALLVKQARQLGVDARWFSGDGTFDPEYVRIAGKENAEGTLLTFYPDPGRRPAARKAIEDYEKRFGEVGPYSLYAYAAALVLLQGIEKAGTLEGASVADAIRTTRFETPFGSIQFDDRGDVLESPYVIWEIRDGRYQQVTGR